MDQSFENCESPENAYSSAHHKEELLNKKKSIGQFKPFEKMLPFATSLSEEHAPFIDCVEVEDIDLSDNDSSDDFKKSLSLNVDSNCRITSRRPSAGNFSKADSCDMQFQEGGVDFSAFNGKRERGSCTDCEDIDLSDEEKAAPNFLNIKCIDLNSFITVSSKLPSVEEMKPANTGSEGSCTDVEVMNSDDDTTVSTIPSTDGGNKGKRKKHKKPITAVLKRMSHNIYMPLNEELSKPDYSQNGSDDVQEESDDEVFLWDTDSFDSGEQEDLSRPFLRRRNFSSGVSSKKTFHGSSLQNTGRKSNSSSLKCEEYENSTDTEILSDDENLAAQIIRPKGRSVRIKSSHMVLNNDSNDLTDEEELLIEGFNTHQKGAEGRSQEWTETDETGNVRQVTQITTETSIKLSGEGSSPELQQIVKSKASETSNAGKLPETDEEMLSFVEKRNFFQRLSLTSETIPTSSKWTQEVSMDDIPMAEGEIVKEQISFEEKFKMFEPDEENMKKKTQKRERVEQPTVYRYNFTKPSKDPPPVPPHPVVGVVSELEKAEQIVQQVNEELNAAECVVNDKETLDSALTLDKVEQEVSSLLAEVDKEERALAAANHFLGDKVNKPMTLNLQAELKQASGEDILDDKITDECIVSDLNPETPETLLSMTGKYYEDDRITPEESHQKTEHILDSNKDLHVQLMEGDHGQVTFSQEQPSAPVKSPVSQSSAYSSLSQQLSNMPEETNIILAPESTAIDAHFESSETCSFAQNTEISEAFNGMKQIDKDTVVGSEESGVCNKTAESADGSTQKPVLTRLDISAKLNDQIKSQIFHEELDQSIEESPLEIKHITEEIKKTLGSDVQRESSVYQHIKTQIFSQELGEDIESGSPEKKVISPTIPEKEIITMVGKLSPTDLESDSLLICKAEEGVTLATAPQEEEHIATCIGSEQETAPESPQARTSESFSDEESFSLAEKLAVEHDDCLKEYEEAKREHSLAEQLQTLASHTHHSGPQVLEDFPGASSDSHLPQEDLGFADVETHTKSDFEVSFSRSNQKEMRSLKSTKQVSTIEELSSIESSDSPQELNQQDFMNADIEIQKEDTLRQSLERESMEIIQTRTEKSCQEELCEKFSDSSDKTVEPSLETKIKEKVSEDNISKQGDFSEPEGYDALQEPTRITEPRGEMDEQSIVQLSVIETTVEQEAVLDRTEPDSILSEKVCAVALESESSGSETDQSANEKSSGTEDEDSKASTPQAPEEVSKLPSIIPRSFDAKKAKDAKEESDGETKLEDGGPKSSELITPHKKEESFSSSGDTTESPYYSVETSDYIRSPRSTPAASRPCSSEFEINVLSGVGSEYETCATSQDVSGEISGSYATAATSQETSYSTACSSLSHSSRESAYSVDSESSGHLASVEISSEASETLVPSAQEMEMEFAPDAEMPVLDEEYSFVDYHDRVKEPYDMDIPESVIRSGIELPFMKGWSVDDMSYGRDVKHLTQQWSSQYQSCHFDTLQGTESGEQSTAADSKHEKEIHCVTEEQLAVSQIMSKFVIDHEPSHSGVNSAESGKSEVVHQSEEFGESSDAPVLSFHEDKCVVESKISIKYDTEAIVENGVLQHGTTGIDEEQLSVSESSVTHSEQTWQTSSVDTAFQVASSPFVRQPMESCTVANEGAEEFPDRQINLEHDICDEPPFSPDPQQSSGTSSFLQLNGPVEVDFNPEYDIPDNSCTAEVNIPTYQPHFDTDVGLNAESEDVESCPMSEDVIQFEAEADASFVNNKTTPSLGDKSLASSECISQTLEPLKSDDDIFYSGISVEAEKPEAQQDQTLDYPDFEESLQPEGLTYQDEATYLPESEQCDLRSLMGESSDTFQKGDLPSGSSSKVTAIDIPIVVQSTDFVEKCDGLDTSPEDERYDSSPREKAYKVFDANQYEEILETNLDSVFDLSVQPIPPESASYGEEAGPDIFDNVSCTDLYTHQEEEEDDLEIREADLVSSPVPSADDDKQSTPSFDTLSGRKFFKIGEHDDSAASSLQEFERLEAEIAAGRSSRGSGDSGDRPVPSKSSEQDDISMNSLTEFEKLEKECVEGDHVNKTTVEEGILLSEIDEGHESQASDGQETLSDDGQHESDDSDDYEKRMSEIDEIIRMAQCNVEQFHEEGVEDLSEGITLEEYSVTQKIHTSNGNSTESSVVDQSPSPKKHINTCGPSKLHDVTLSDSSLKHFTDDAQRETDPQETSECQLEQSSPTQEPPELHPEPVDSTHTDIWLEKKLLGHADDCEPLDGDNGVGPDSSSSGEKNGAKGDCMVSSSDSIDPSSSTATHATYQFETDSVMSSSINSAQASGEECTMVSSTDTLESEAVLTYTQGEIMSEEKADGALGNLSDKSFVRMSFPEASSILSELEASTESSHSTIREELPKYDIEEKVKSFLKKSAKTSDDPGEIASGPKFCDPEKISKDILQALEKLEVNQQSGEIQFEKIGKNGKVVKVTQHVIKDSHSGEHDRDYSHEQMEMFLNKLTDEYQESHESVIMDLPQGALSSDVQCDQHIQSESYSTFSVPKAFHDSATFDSSSLPSEISLPHQTAALGFSLSEEEKMGEDGSHTTTTTTTRIVTTVTTQDGEEQEQLTTEGGDELRHSMEVILNQFMSEGPPSTQSEQPPQ